MWTRMVCCSFLKHERATFLLLLKPENLFWISCSMCFFLGCILHSPAILFVTLMKASTQPTGLTAGHLLPGVIFLWPEFVTRGSHAISFLRLGRENHVSAMTTFSFGADDIFSISCSSFGCRKELLSPVLISHYDLQSKSQLMSLPCGWCS